MSEGLADKILAARDLAVEKVHVPEWDVDLYLHELDGVDRLSFDDETAEVTKDGGKESGMAFGARYLVHAVRDEAGARVFTSAQAAALSRKNPKVVARLFKRASALSIVGEEEVEAEAGKSVGAPSGASSGA